MPLLSGPSRAVKGSACPRTEETQSALTPEGSPEAVAPLIRELALSPAHPWRSAGAARPPEDVPALPACLLHSPGRGEKGGRESRTGREAGTERRRENGKERKKGRRKGRQREGKTDKKNREKKGGNNGRHSTLCPRLRSKPF